MPAALYNGATAWYNNYIVRGALQMNATTKHLHALPFWDHLSDAEKDILCNNAHIRSFDRDSYILHSKAGEDIGLMMLIEGSVRAYLLSPDGRETTLFSLHDQSICIFSALSLFNQISFQVFLTSDCCSKIMLLHLDILVIEHIREHPKVSTHFCSSLGSRVLGS